VSDRSAIEWTDATWNPIRARNLATGKVGWHCEHVCEACRHCYAEGINRRLGTGHDFKPGRRWDIEIFLDTRVLMQPLRWKKPRTIFAGSMTDLFANFVHDEWLERIFAVAALASHHRILFLTKRAERMRKYLSTDPAAMLSRCPEARIGAEAMRIARARGEKADDPWWGAWWQWPLPHIWLGVSAGDQATADARVLELLKTPAAVRFASIEPLLEPVSLSPYLGEWFSEGGEVPGLDWVIAGGESGPQARPAHPEWFHSLRDQCQAAQVPFFFKQWGEWTPSYGDDSVTRRAVCLHRGGSFEVPAGTHSRQFDLLDRALMKRAGKKAAGRLLDGREWSEFPR
jgi:protein gp37